MFIRRQRMVLASSLVVACSMLALVAALAQTQSTRPGNLPMATKATFNASGVGSCPAGYVLDSSYPAASACRLQVFTAGNTSCPAGYARQSDGSCALQSVAPDKKGQCPDVYSVFNKSNNRCEACYNAPKNPSKTCKDGDCGPKKCG